MRGKKKQKVWQKWNFVEYIIVFCSIKVKATFLQKERMATKTTRNENDKRKKTKLQDEFS